MKLFNCIYTYGNSNIEVDVKFECASESLARKVCFGRGAKKIVKIVEIPNE